MLNGEKVATVDFAVTPQNLRIGADGKQELMLQAGKKRFFRFIVR
jgi:hypothetical protein